METNRSLPPTAEMYEALVNRDGAYEGVFYLGVRTTGIFCRPTCPARKPKRENVEFFASTQAALLAGYRPCRRCTPMQPEGVEPGWIAGLIEAVEADPARRWTDADLRAAGLDPARVRRWFKRHHEMTFHAYQRARRLGLALGQIRNGDDIMGTAYDHGYESLSGFRDAFANLFGEPPGKSRKSGRGGGRGNRASVNDGTMTHVVVTRVLTPLGPLVAGATDEGLCMLEFAGRPMLETQIARIRKYLGGTITPGSNEHIEAVEAELARYFAGELTEFTVPMLTPGTEFQQKVWNALRAIPYGETRSYEEIARDIGNPRAVRAVGSANGANRIPIVIPCHRVVRADGSLGGYGGELWRKRFLLELEGHTRFIEPQRRLALSSEGPAPPSSS
jgi:AraC family transcriptional regulator of adaptative response/methylated-DNA-[protein]-cysteine methyltransferase